MKYNMLGLKKKVKNKSHTGYLDHATLCKVTVR